MCIKNILVRNKNSKKKFIQENLYKNFMKKIKEKISHKKNFNKNTAKYFYVKKY